MNDPITFRVPEGMNGYKLRLIASALDASDELTATIAKLADTEIRTGTEMQDDLRRWADLLDQAEYAMHEPAPAPANVIDPKQAA